MKRRAERKQARKKRQRIAQQQAAIYDQTCGLCPENERKASTMTACENCPFLQQNMLMGERLLSISKKDKARVRKEAERNIRKRQLNMRDYLVLTGVYPDQTIIRMSKMPERMFREWKDAHGLIKH